MTAEHDLFKLIRGWRVEPRTVGTSMPFWELRKPNDTGGTTLVAKIYHSRLAELLQVVCQQHSHYQP